jgi:hypothetical protein
MADLPFKVRFSTALNRQLLDYYGRIPSASILARDFNLRAKQLPPITQETARRWIRGLSLPDIDKLAILSNWLRINIQISHENPVEAHGPADGSAVSKYVENAPRKTSLNEAELFLLKVFQDTDIRGKQILLAIAKTLNVP